MALSKSKTLTNGATGTYWKITKATVDKGTMTATWVINLFADQAHANANAPIGSQSKFSAPVTKLQLIGDITALGYTTIKSQSKVLIGMNGSTPIHANEDLWNATDIIEPKPVAPIPKPTPTATPTPTPTPTPTATPTPTVTSTPAPTATPTPKK